MSSEYNNELFEMENMIQDMREELNKRIERLENILIKLAISTISNKPVFPDDIKQILKKEKIISE
jgi:hypothetical protein